MHFRHITVAVSEKTRGRFTAVKDTGGDVKLQEKHNEVNVETFLTLREY